MAQGSISIPNNEANQYLLQIVHTQIGEMELVRSKIYQLEQTHRQKLAQYVRLTNVPSASTATHLTRVVGMRKKSPVCTASWKREELHLKASMADHRSLPHPASATALRTSSRASWLVVGKVEVSLLRRKNSRGSQACQDTCKHKDPPV